MSKNTTIVIAMLMAILVLAVAGCQQLPAAPASVSAPAALAAPEGTATRTITVIGTGSMFVEPDVAEANVGVNVSAATVEQASDQVNQRMAAVLKALDEEGIAERDIQTSNYSIYFEERPDLERMPMSGGEQGPAGVYRVSNQVRIVIRDLDRVGEILDAVIQAGANNVYGVTFTREDAEAARRQARSEAVQNARAKAQEYARLNSLTLGEVISVSEVIGGSMPFVGVREAAGYGGGGPDISPGQLEVQVQIQITYEVTR